MIISPLTISPFNIKSTIDGGGGSSLLNDITAYYKLDETNGDVIDSVAGNSGTNVGATRGVTGKIGDCFTFDGVNDYVQLDSAINLTGDCTYSIWFKQNFSGNNIFDSVAGTTNRITIVSATSVRVKINGTTNYNFSVSTISNSVWNHVLFTRSGTDGRLWLNNVESSTGIRTVPADTWVIDRISASSNPWDGELDELGIWSRALTADERTEVYNSGDGVSYPF